MGVSIEYLIPELRIRVGDINETNYRYLDEWLLLSLVASIRGLERYWGSKYKCTLGGYVTRNDDYVDFEFEESEGVIQRKDEEIIILKAAIILLEGSLENSAWDVGSWKDAEISYSNIESGRIRSELLRSLKTELDSLIKPPMKRLVYVERQSILEDI